MERLTVSEAFDKSIKHLKFIDYFQKIHEISLLIVE